MQIQHAIHKKEIFQKFEEQKSNHLGYSLVLDFLGMGTYFIPILGEGFDLIYAPIYGVAIYSIYQIRLGKARAMAGGVFGMIEEALPFTDVIPTAFILWVYTYKVRRKKTLRTFTRNIVDEHEIIEQELYGRPQKQWSFITRLKGMLGFNTTTQSSVYDNDDDYLELQDNQTELLDSPLDSPNDSEYV